MMQRRRSRGVVVMRLPAVALIVMLAGACSLRTSRQPGATLDLTILRNGQRQTVRVTLGQRP